jgi:hypothetical protein
MAGEMTPEQWDMISKTLDKISILCETTIPKLDKKIDLVSSSIRGNGHKGLKTFVEEHEKKIEDIKNNKPKPVYSGKQVLSILAIVIVVGGFISSQTAYVGIDISAKMVRLETKIDQHILNP